MKASPEAQRRLLDLQAVDTALAQLAHRRKSLPEFAEIDTVARELSALEDERVRAQVAVDDLDRDISRFEKDIEQVRQRKVRGRLAAAQERRTQAERRRDEAMADIAKEVEFKTASRGPLAADLPADLVALYDKIRLESALGAALFRSGRCGGCRIELYGADLARVKAAAPDDVVRCEECRRIMVRTAESGL